MMQHVILGQSFWQFPLNQTSKAGNLGFNYCIETHPSKHSIVVLYSMTISSNFESGELSILLAGFRIKFPPYTPQVKQKLHATSGQGILRRKSMSQNDDAGHAI
jgi:hypothetical protein